MGLGGGSSVDDRVGGRRCGDSVGDVVGDGHVEEGGVLRDESDVVS